MWVNAKEAHSLKFNFLNPLKHEKKRDRAREKRKWGVVRNTTFNGENREKFTAVKVPRQSPLVLLVKAG
jgi:hypothetical protein